MLPLGSTGRLTYVLFESTGNHVSQSHLGPASDTLKGHLDSDRGIGSSMRSRRHLDKCSEVSIQARARGYKLAKDASYVGCCGQE
jgi:hypothetical protein